MSNAIGPIEKGVPVPTSRGLLRTALAELGVGESRLIEGYKAAWIRTAAERNGISVRVRPEGNGFRIWRIS